MTYQRQDSLLSPAERSFFGVLHTALAQRYVIFAKVRLADLICVPRGAERWQSQFNRITAKHVDFVLCDASNLRPLLAIELDDSSHRRAATQHRDAFVDSALAAAGLPILHVTARAAYNPHELNNAINQALTA